MVATDRAGRDRRFLLPLLVVAPTAIFLAMGGYFATVQNVWVDESTQLLGSALPFGRLLAWLAGHAEPLGVPPDRMPPLGYFLDWGWTRVAGPAPFGYRLLHLAFAGAGVAGLIALAMRRNGAVAALVTGALLVASPGLITVGVEIRAYPLFFAATVLQLWLLHRLCREELPSSARLMGFAAAGLIAVYIHFFGLISTSALFSGLIVARARSLVALARIGAAWVGFLLLSAGIAPFVGGARAISDDSGGEVDLLGHAMAYLPRIYGHAAMLLHPYLTVLLFGALGAVLIAAIYRTARALPSRPTRAPAGFEAALIVTLVAGLFVTIGAALVVHGFDPMKPSYSIWMVPLIALLAGAACAPGAWIATPARVLAIVAVGALLPIDLAFARHAEWFVHGPEGAISAAIGDRRRDTAILYVDRGWPYGYYPLVRRFGRSLPQYLLDGEGRLRPLRDADASAAPVPETVLDGMRQVLVISIETHTGRDLGTLIDGAADPALFGPPSAKLDGWHDVNSLVRPGLYWLRLTRMERNHQ